ncbi:Eco57I restriction-modification methylase domain-containing protein [Burkholderia sp. AU36459]|uniref:Eco57I restriction-modification methylase domain-containing protein n=1 Tax=Burkholderia sp. AU36459 TaxID=2879632 RepID=UPI001CF4BD7F|nr:N-6 DNA methylase [Burkholderia sp. AU36459]MCA8109228.1 N-6 DNA methylase [Burkholderia sp. AU36459]
MTVHSQLLDLVARFAADETKLISSTSGYQETEVRVEYIDPLLELLGWDMTNARGLPNNLKDVLREESQEGDGGRPDYTFRIASAKKFFIEAKKPSVDIANNRAAAFQVRSYGHTVGLPVSILTNFRTLRIYDTRLEPKLGDDADVGLLDSIDYADLPARFADLHARFGRDNVARGSIDSMYGNTTAGTLAVSEKFLARINGWRLRLTNELHERYPELSVAELSDLAQKVVNRIIFLRMCEDRGIEARETLRKVAGKRSCIELRTLFKKLDDRYNTGLFDVSQDRFQDRYELNATLFYEFVEEVYSPTSPYSFAVLDADFLGQVYEHFLAERLELLEDGSIGLVKKPDYEDREIVTTPQPLVEEVIQRAVNARFSAAPVSTFEELCEVKILDIAVGSGRFLVHALDKLVDTAIGILQRNPKDLRIYKVSGNEVRLRFEAKCQLLEKCLFGIDVDFNAIEVARFGLIVKLLEDETFDTLPAAKRILPDLNANVVWGNTVVGKDFDAPSSVVDKTVPIDWATEGLPSKFDVVVGNPPYVTTEDMRKANRYEFDYYKEKYDSSHKQFDKYFIFIERSLNSLTAAGAVGLLVPNKWLTIESATKLRKLLIDRVAVREILNFGNESLFAGKSAYVCILVLQSGIADFCYRDIHKQAEFELDPNGKGYVQSATALTGFGEGAWVLPGTPEEHVVLKMLYRNSRKLSGLVDIKNGVQTSKNNVFVISNYVDAGATVVFDKEGKRWEVEKALTRPYVADSGQVKSFRELSADALVIFPYRVGPNGAAQVLSPEALRRSFPLGWNYLYHYRTVLERRDVAPPPPEGVFYAFGRHQALDTVFKCPKIIYSVNQTGDKYAFDTVGVAVASGGTAGEVMVLNPRDGYSLEFIMGLLNQRAIEYFVRKRGSPFRGGYYSRGSAVLADVPVPALDLTNDATHIGAHEAIVQNVREIMDLKSKLAVATGRLVTQFQRRLHAAEENLERRFNALWGFSDQVKLINLPGE